MIFKQLKKTDKDFRVLNASSIALRKRTSELANRTELFNTAGIPENSKGKNGDIAIAKDGKIYRKEGGRWL